MKTHVEFRSSSFPPYDGEEELVNPDRYGKRLAQYLQRELPKHGLPVTGISPEDWGWMVELENETFPLWIGCGHYQEYEDGFLCFVEPGKAVIRRGFRRIDTRPRLERVASALDAILDRAPDVHSVRWWTAEEAGI